MAYYTEWDSKIHLRAFRKRLDDNQICTKCFGITISNEDKLQFYLEQMYVCNHFDKKKMIEWENKIITIKDNFDKAKLYFEELVRDYEVYAQKHRRQAQLRKHEISNRRCDAGDELRKYIAGIAQAAVTQEARQL